jgi:DNA-directed RNA polymerase specialized sigma24 family protein
LRFYSEQSCQQIAETLNVPIGTVTKQLSRAYEKLRSFLEEKNEA